MIFVKEDLIICFILVIGRNHAHHNPVTKVRNPWTFHYIYDQQ